MSVIIHVTYDYSHLVLAMGVTLIHSKGILLLLILHLHVIQISSIVNKNHLLQTCAITLIIFACISLRVCVSKVKHVVKYTVYDCVNCYVLPQLGTHRLCSLFYLLCYAALLSFFFFFPGVTSTPCHHP